MACHSCPILWGKSEFTTSVSAAISKKLFFEYLLGQQDNSLYVLAIRNNDYDILKLQAVEFFKAEGVTFAPTFPYKGGISGCEYTRYASLWPQADRLSEE